MKRRGKGAPQKVGSAGRDATRTHFSIQVLMAMPLMCRDARPFIVQPFHYPEDYWAKIAMVRGNDHDREKRHRHAIHVALKWKQILANDNTLTTAKIARKQGISRARVCQVMRLLSLPEEVQDVLVKLSDPAHIRLLNERRMRAIALLPERESQLNAFGNLFHRIESDVAI